MHAALLAGISATSQITILRCRSLCRSDTGQQVLKLFVVTTNNLGTNLSIGLCTLILVGGRKVGSSEACFTRNVHLAPCRQRFRGEFKELKEYRQRISYLIHTPLVHHEDRCSLLCVSWPLGWVINFCEREDRSQ